MRNEADDITLTLMMAWSACRQLERAGVFVHDVFGQDFDDRRAGDR